MLADTPLPHGSGANLAMVGTLSEGFRRIVTAPPLLVGYVRWDARSDHSSFRQTIMFSSLQIALCRKCAVRFEAICTNRGFFATSVKCFRAGLVAGKSLKRVVSAEGIEPSTY